MDHIYSQIARRFPVKGLPPILKLNARLIHREFNQGRLCRRFFNAVLRLAANFRGHLKWLHLMDHPCIIELKSLHPGLVYKYLHSDYLSRGFSTDVRLQILMNHYECLKNRISETFLPKIFDDGYLLWQESIKGSVLGIVISYPKQHDQEGELCLSFVINGEPIYEVVFVIMEGAALEIENEHVCLVTTIQGEAGQMTMIRKATQICHDSSPIYLLLAAVQAVAISLDVRIIAGMRRQKPVYGEDRRFARIFFFDYEKFWQSLVGSRTTNTFYTAPIPLSEKSISLIKSNRRSRALQRREIRNRIYKETQVSFTYQCLRHSSDQESARRSP
jgi:uncharacterized protein VirK/YbjX